MAEKDREPKKPKDGEGEGDEKKAEKRGKKSIFNILVFPQRPKDKDAKDREKRK